MDSIVLPNTDILVSRICMGCMTVVDNIFTGSKEEKQGIETLRKAYDEGITFFDTSEMYDKGGSERLLGKALGDRRKELVFATKVHPKNLSYEKCISACEQSLRYLGTDYIDLYQLHWHNPDIPHEETCRALAKLLEDGKIRAVGVCNFGQSDLEAFAKYLVPCTDQISYSLLWRAGEFSLLKACRDMGVGLLCYSPLLHGLLTGKYVSIEDVPEGIARTRHFSADRPQSRHSEPGCETELFEAISRLSKIAGEAGLSLPVLAIAWVLARPGVTSVIAGASRPSQVESSILAERTVLDQSLIEACEAATVAVKEKLGLNMDMWQTESRVI